MDDLAVPSASAPHRGRDAERTSSAYPAPAVIFAGDEPRHYDARCPRSAAAHRTVDTSGVDHDRNARSRSSASQWIGRSTEATDIVTVAARHGPARDAVPGHRRAEHLATSAPYTVHWCLATAGVSARRNSDPMVIRPAAAFLPPVPLPRRMWAGGEVEFIDPTARRRSTPPERLAHFKDVSLKSGSTGQLMLRVSRA